MGRRNMVLTRGPVEKILIQLTIPMIFGMISMVVFNIVDTYYIGKLGTNQMAAITFTFPVVLVINSISHGIGVGAAAAISRAFGEGNHQKIQRYTTDSLILGVCIVVLFAAIGLFTIKPLFRLLGADSQILPYIVEYMRIWYIGVAFVVIPMIGNNAIRALGDTKTPSVVMAVAALANAILDPLLIFGYAFVKPMGISGAAIATVISRAITLVVALRILIGREKLIVFKGVKLKEMCASWRDILFIGLPDALTKMIVPIAAGILTGIVALFGKEAVASFGIGTRLEMFVLMVNGALASVMIPFIGQNLGAGELGRVKKGIRAGEFFVIFYGIGMAVIFIVFGRFFAEIFTASDIVADLVQQYLWIVPLSYFAQGIILISGTGFIVMRKPIITALLTAVRMFAICVPLAMLWAKSYGLVGVWASISVSFFIIALAAHVLMMHHLKQLSR